MDMSDLATFKAMLKRAGIPWKDGSYGESLTTLSTGERGDTVISVMPGGDAVVGYVMFFTEFAFAPDGSLRIIGCWE